MITSGNGGHCRTEDKGFCSLLRRLLRGGLISLDVDDVVMEYVTLLAELSIVAAFTIRSFVFFDRDFVAFFVVLFSFRFFRGGSQSDSESSAVAGSSHSDSEDMVLSVTKLVKINLIKKCLSHVCTGLVPTAHNDANIDC